MWVKRDDNGGPISSTRMLGRRRDHCLVSKVNTVEHPNCEEQWSAQFRQLRNGMKNLHHDDESETNSNFEFRACFEIRISDFDIFQAPRILDT